MLLEYTHIGITSLILPTITQVIPGAIHRMKINLMKMTYITKIALKLAKTELSQSVKVNLAIEKSLTEMVTA